MEVIAAQSLAALGLFGWGAYKASQWPNWRKNPTHYVKGLRGYKFKAYQPKPGENKIRRLDYRRPEMTGKGPYENVKWPNSERTMQNQNQHIVHRERIWHWVTNPDGTRSHKLKRVIAKYQRKRLHGNPYKSYFARFKPYKLI